MKNAKKIMMAGLLISAGYSALASAHTQSGTLGNTTSGAAATDVYQLSCPAGTARLYVRIKDLAPALPSLVSIQAAKDRLSSTLSVDGADGDAFYSSAVTLRRVAGTYLITINKNLSSTKGREIYSAEFHCQDAGGNHLGNQPDPVMTQNQ
jgi:hypothetical protein